MWHIPCDEAVAEEASSSSSSATAEPSRVSLEGILSAKAASAVASADMDGEEGKWYPRRGRHRIFAVYKWLHGFRVLSLPISRHNLRSADSNLAPNFRDAAPVLTTTCCLILEA